MTRPLMFVWQGDGFTPRSAYWQGEADKQFVVGQIYLIEAVEERSIRSHNHFFASVAEAWRNLPDNLLALHPSPEHLRKHALIRAGYHESKSIVCSSAAEAQKVAAFIKPDDDYAIVIVRDNVVTRYMAKSQSMKAMGKKEFQASKDAVLDEIAKIIGVDPASLGARAA